MYRLPYNLLILMLVVPICAGCIQRRMIIRSQPEGAFVTVDNVPIGRTPLSVRYTYSGTREFKLEKDGFKTVKVQQRFDPKWYQTFPISLFSENFAGREIRDERVLDFQLEPKVQIQENLLLNRANDLRFNINRGTITGPLN
ncbi:MAG: PEGA domain-containing protein [Planctomycetota bacterium]